MVVANLTVAASMLEGCKYYTRPIFPEMRRSYNRVIGSNS
jgi:hypothetical protein